MVTYHYLEGMRDDSKMMVEHFHRTAENTFMYDDGDAGGAYRKAYSALQKLEAQLSM